MVSGGGRVRAVLTTLLELAGLGSVTTGAALLHPAAGFITGGVCAVLAGASLGRPLPVASSGDEVG